MYAKAISLILFLVFLAAPIANAQEDIEWQEAEDGGAFNCAILSEFATTVADDDADVITEYGLQPFYRQINGNVLNLSEYVGLTYLLSLDGEDDVELTFSDIFAYGESNCTEGDDRATEGSGETLFTVVANSNANLRECGSTDCAVVGSAAAGDLFNVIADEGDWYQITTEDGTAFISAQLVSRGPDDVIDVNDPYFDENTGCSIVFDVRRGDADLRVIFFGDQQTEILVDVFRPNESRPLSVEGQLDKQFLDTNEPYIDQYYSWNVGYPLGTYQLEVQYAGQTSRFAWEMDARGEYVIYVSCE